LYRTLNIYLKTLYIMFTQLYLDTTNPNLTYSQLLGSGLLIKIIAMVILYTIIYSGVVNLAFYIFTGRVLTAKINRRLTLSLILIMFFGYIGRLFVTKDVYAAYNKDPIKTRQHIDKGFISWIFIA